MTKLISVNDPKQTYHFAILPILLVQNQERLLALGLTFLFLCKTFIWTESELVIDLGQCQFLLLMFLLNDVNLRLLNLIQNSRTEY